MFQRLAALIVAIGVMACVMLAVRQQRVQAAHELADLQRRVAEHDRTLWRLRLEVAMRTTPAHVEAAAAGFAGLEPIIPDRYQALVKREAEALARTALTANTRGRPD